MSSYGDIIRQANSSRIKYVYTALVEIRKTYIKSPKGVARLVSGGLVSRLLELTRTRTSLDEQYRLKVTDMVVSVLGNMCMENCTRNQVIKERGVPVIAELFLSADTVTLQNRTCRCLANLLLTPGSWELAESSAVIERIVKLLKDTDDDECRQTYIRTIRLLGKTGSHVQRLVEKNAICVVVKLIDKNRTPVAKAALRSLHSLSIHSCTIQFASQVISGGKLTVLLDLTKSYNEEAFKLLVKLCDHHTFRPEFGNAGGIITFHELLHKHKELIEEQMNEQALFHNRRDLVRIETLNDGIEKKCGALDDKEKGKGKTEDVQKDEHNNEEKVAKKHKTNKKNPDVGESKLKGVNQDKGRLEAINGQKDVQKNKEKVGKNDDTNKKQATSIGECNEDENQHERKLETNKDIVDIRRKLCQWIPDLLSVLSLCCKEAVNRVKLREEKVLVTLIKMLGEPEVETVHGRIISAFVCFLYDDPGFEMLLEHGLVNVLVRILKHMFGSELAEEADHEVVEYVCIGNGKTENKYAEIIADKVVHKEEKTADGKGFFNKPSTSFSDPKAFSGHEADVMKMENPGSEISPANACGSVEDAGSSKRTKPVYSIDSPTYEPNTEWSDYHVVGAKCIEKFTPPHSIDWKSKSYSPMSNISYYSSGESSPEYSPQSSPCTSPLGHHGNNSTNLSGCHGYSPSSGAQSPENLHPKYPKYTGINCQQYGTDHSPVLNPEQGTSKRLTRNNWSFSSSDSESDKTNDNPTVGIPWGVSNDDDEVDVGVRIEQLEYSPVSSPIERNKLHELDRDIIDHLTASENLQNETRDVDKLGKSTSDLKKESVKNSSEYDDNIIKKDWSVGEEIDLNTIKIDQEEIDKNRGENETGSVVQETKQAGFVSTEKQRKLNKKRKKVISHCSILENNIFILLSRVSQMNNPTMHLVTKEVLSGFLDYISYMESPLARCPRLLSRVCRNPLCFQKLLSSNFPVTVYEKLCVNENIEGLTKSLKKVEKEKGRRRSSSGSLSNLVEMDTDSDRFSMSEDSNLDDFQQSKRQKTGNETKGRTFKGVYHTQTADVCVPSKSGLALLQDLSGVVDTQYGRGCVDRLLVTLTCDLHLDLCINMLYITWTYGSRQYYFTQREILDKLLAVLKDGDTSAERYQLLIDGLSFLAKVIGTRNKYQLSKSSSHHSFTGAITVNKSSLINYCTGDGKSTTRPIVDFKCSQGDIYSGQENTVTFLVGGEKVLAKKDILVSQSEIFSAMLQGHYSEAHLSEIPIPETSAFNFQCLIHYLHDCGSKDFCVLNKFNSREVDQESADLAMELANEADKYMISPLKELACKLLFDRYIIPRSAPSVFKFAVLHRRHDLLKAAVSCVLVDTTDSSETANLLFDFLHSKYSEIFLNTLADVLTE